MSVEMQECAVIKDDVVDIILIKKTNCSMQETIDKAIEKLREL